MNVLGSRHLPQFVVVCIVGAASACATRHPEPYRPSFATGLEMTESDGVLIEWRNCSVDKPCVTGSLGGKTYSFGFPSSPSELEGRLGDQPVKLTLDPASIFRLGDHDIELQYLDRASGLLPDYDEELGR